MCWSSRCWCCSLSKAQFYIVVVAAAAAEVNNVFADAKAENVFDAVEVNVVVVEDIVSIVIIV